MPLGPKLINVPKKITLKLIALQICLPYLNSPVSTSRLTEGIQNSKVISSDVLLNTIDLTENVMMIT